MAPLFTGLRLGFGRSAEVGDAGPVAFATGGTVTAAGITPGNGYRYHVFTAPGTFTVSGGPGSVEYLVVAGGGSGGLGYGGGGAGGLRTNVSGNPLAGSSMALAPGPYPVSVGSGAPWPGTSQGSVSSFNSITSTGGGYGAGNNIEGFPSPPGGAGGSGGGGGYSGSANPGPGNNPPTSPSQGNPGGNGVGPNGTAAMGGGGGGAGGAGGNADQNVRAGDGGAGHPIPAFAAPLISPEIPSPIQPRWIPAVGPTGLYAGGAGGGSTNSNNGNPGPGGGGTRIGSNFPGVDYTGGGGSPAGNGGTGIVIIRYLV